MLSWIGAVLINGLAVVITLVVLAAALFGAMHKGFDKRGPNRAKILEAFGVKSDEEQERAVLVGFFHPYCNAGGGGERVLWTAITAIQQHSKLLRAHSQAKRGGSNNNNNNKSQATVDRLAHTYCVVYTGDTDATSEAILRRAQQRFNLKIDSSRVVIIHLQRRDWVEARRYPVFTILGETLGSLVLGYEALNRVVPDIFIDSMGYAFTYPLVRYFTRGSVPLLAYVHYPTISTDMLERVQTGQTGVESHRSLAGRHPLLGFAKSLYYRLFAAAYGWAGSFIHMALTSSTWTRNHIDQLWHATRLTTAKSSTVGVGGASRGSGGQLITTVTGYLAETCDEYVKAMETALALSDDERNALTARARKDAAERFSEEVFNRGFLRNYTALAECLNA
ncbi:hypothetical protein GQ42DRAFT_178626 [Ramicandelaber brevisporus]|nr:hypothetical protein GQ42DRAFT_178626 [Ramicandelaber brevisporus]